MNFLRCIGRLSLIVLAGSHCTGCGGPEHPATFPVEGTVTYQGKPVDGATISLIPLEIGSRGAAATSGADGSFSMSTFAHGDGAIPGEYLVTVFKYDEAMLDAAVADAAMTLEEEEEMYTDDEAEGGDAGPRNLLPAKYADAMTSGLSIVVSESPNVLPIDLE